MTYRQDVRELALDQYGYITTAEAEEIDVPAVELRKLAARGALTHVGRGLYRVADAPATNRDQLAEAVRLMGRDAYLTHDAVLALHQLALVNPRRIRVATPHRVRAVLPGFIQLVHRTDLPPAALTIYEGIPCTTVAQALLDCRGLVMTERLAEARRDALRQGLLTTGESRRLRAALAA